MHFALRRTLSSLAAIIAISVIFGAKALESERLQASTGANLASAVDRSASSPLTQ